MKLMITGAVIAFAFAAPAVAQYTQQDRGPPEGGQQDRGGQMQPDAHREGGQDSGRPDSGRPDGYGPDQRRGYGDQMPQDRRDGGSDHRGYGQDEHRGYGDHMRGDGGGYAPHAGYSRRHLHRVCTWRHHHRVCSWR